MFKLKVGKKDYTVRYGYRAVAKSGITKKAMNVQNMIDDDNMGELIEEMLNIVAEMLLAGLQKTEKSFAVDYDDEADVKAKIEKVYDLLDDYLEEEDSLAVTEIFEKLMTELFEAGFFGKKSQTLENALTENDSTVVPIDHKR